VQEVRFKDPSLPQVLNPSFEHLLVIRIRSGENNAHPHRGVRVDDLAFFLKRLVVLEDLDRDAQSRGKRIQKIDVAAFQPDL
jgi:hypothetical protein